MKYINLLLALGLILISLLIFKSWFLSPIIASGDFWYYFSSMLQNYSFYPLSWYSIVGTGLGGQGIVYQNPVMVFSIPLYFADFFNLNWSFVNKLFFYFPFIIVSFLSSSFLIKKILPKSNFWILTPLIFTFNTYILMVVGGGQILIGLSYAITPLVLYSFIKLIESYNQNKSNISLLVVLASLLLFIQTVLDLRIAFVTSVALCTYLLISVFLKFNFKKIILFLLPFGFLALLSAYWLIPVIIFGIDPIKQLGTDYRSVDIVKFLSFAKLENSIGLFHPYWPENIFGKIGFMKPEFLLLPILAFSSLLFIKKDKTIAKYILFFALIGLLGIFLGKGASEPFDGMYIWLFDNVPGFQLFRDSFKWYVLIAISYSILIPLTVNEVYELLKHKSKFTIFSFQFTINSKIFNFSNLFILILLCYFLFLLKPAILGQLNGTFQKRDVLGEYAQLDKYLSQDNTFFRTLWIPNTMLFGHYTNSHPQISGRDFFREYSHNELLSKFSSESVQKTLDFASVKYVIVPADTENEIYLTERKPDEKKYLSVVNKLDEISWLQKDKQLGKIIVYKTKSNKDHFWCDCDAIISYEFINPTKYSLNIKNAKKGDRIVFSEAFDDKWVAESSKFIVQSSKFKDRFNSFVILGDGDFFLEVYYGIQKYVDLGVKISLLTFFTLILIFLLSLVFKRKK